jgi:hypothetical protein
MNPIMKILEPLTRAFNDTIDGMPRKTAEMIRQTFILIIVILCIAGAVIGFTKGKHSAKKTGIQMAETTNDIFDIDIQQRREGGKFESVLDSEIESGLDMKDPEKKGLPAREKLAAEDSVRIAEPEKDRHIKPGPDAADKNDLAAPDRIDGQADARKTSKTIDRKADKAPAEISDKKIDPLIEEPSKTGDIRGDRPVKGKTRETIKLKPLDKKGGIAE